MGHYSLMQLIGLQIVEAFLLTNQLEALIHETTVHYYERSPLFL